MSAYGGTLTIGFSGGGATKSDTITKSSTGRVSFEESVANGQTDFQINCPTVDVSACVMLYIKSTQDVTLETNSGTPGEGVDSLTLKANEPYIWWTGAPFTNVLDTDITTNVFITNASGAAAVVTFEAILDTTPA
jgi:hypothetical protein